MKSSFGFWLHGAAAKGGDEVVMGFWEPVLWRLLRAAADDTTSPILSERPRPRRRCCGCEADGCSSFEDTLLLDEAAEALGDAALLLLWWA